MKSVAVLYYEAILKLCDACGLYLEHSHLYSDLRSFEPLPDSHRVLVYKHDGSMAILRHKMGIAWTNRAEISESIIDFSVTLGLYKSGDEMREDEKVISFCDMLLYRTEICDFRKKVRDYAKQQLRHISNGKEVKLMSLGDFVDRYAKLVEARHKRKKKK